MGMARYVNIYPEKNLVIQKAYDSDFGDWICEYEFMAAFYNDLELCTADVCLKEYVDGQVRILMPYDCPARDRLIKEKITELVCNQGCVDGCGLAESICHVVSLLERHGMWKKEYAKCIDVKKIKEEWDEE